MRTWFSSTDPITLTLHEIMKQTYSECVVRSGNINLYLSLRYQDLYNQIGKDFSGIAQ